MGGKSSKQTVGYKFYAGAVLVLGKFVSKITRIQIGDKDAWEGVSTGGVININKPTLHGTKAEGGVVGDFVFQRGEPDQLPDPYLVNKLGPDISADRGVSQLVLRQPYLGNTPYIKDIVVRGERIHELDGGEPQWYDEKAAISQAATANLEIGPTSDGWRYKVVASGDGADYSDPEYDDSVWDMTSSPFASSFSHPIAPSGGWPNAANQVWPLNTNIWLRKKFVLETTAPLTCTIFVDNYSTVWLNGTLILPRVGSTAQPGFEAFEHQFVLPAELLAPMGEFNTLVVKGEDEGSYSYAAIRVDQTASVAWDINPAHMLRECLLNKEWGYGYDETDLDEASFIDTANKLYDENFGLSYFWDNDSDLATIVNKVLDHIDGVLYLDRATLTWKLSLVRNDYDPDDLIELRDGVEVTEITNYKKPQFQDLVNTVTVNFYNSQNSGNGSLSQSDSALFLQQGQRVAKSVDYEMCCSPYLASLLLQRELDIRSTPLASCDVTATSAAKGLRRGSVFKLTASRFNFYATIMRVLEINYGDGKTKEIKIKCVEDRFGLPTAPGISVQPPVVEPSTPPSPLVARAVMEEPYFMLVARLGQATVDDNLALYPTEGFVGAVAGRTGSATAADIYTSTGSGYTTDGATLDFAPYGRLASAVDADDTNFTLTAMTDLEELDGTQLFIIDDEVMAYTTLDLVTGVMTGVKRGLYDTVPALHASNAPVLFIENWMDGPAETFVDGETVNVKLLPYSSAGQLALADAPVDTVVFDQRAWRPYRPANVRYNTQVLPQFFQGALTVTWRNRNRLMETTPGTYVDYYATTNLTLESGATHTWVLKRGTSAGTTLRTYAGLATELTKTWTDEVADSPTNPLGRGAVIYNDQQFNSTPTGFATLRQGSGAATMTWDASTDAVTLENATASQSVWDFTSLASMVEVMVEADLEVLADTAGTSWCGLWMANEADTAGYAFTYRSDQTPKWRIERLTSLLGTPTLVSGSVINAVPDLVKGQRRRFKAVFNTVTREQSLYVDGVLVVQAADPAQASGTTYRAMRPGIFWWGTRLRVYETRVWGIAAQAPLLNNQVTADLYSIRNSVEQRQRLPQTMRRVGYGYSYGYSYGGV